MVHGAQSTGQEHSIAIGSGPERRSGMTETRAKLTKFLTCQLCTKLFTEPKTLFCLHTFCEKCLSAHTDEKPADEHGGKKVRVVCPIPTCKYEQVLDEADKEVATNSSFKNMVVHLSLEKRVRTGPGPPNSESGPADGATGGKEKPAAAKCESCRQDNDAMAFCGTCNRHLCETCRNYHQIAMDFESHEVKPLKDLHSSSSEDDSQIVTHYTWKCCKHKDADQAKGLTYVTIYCEECDLMICNKCAIVEPHGNHKKFEASVVIDEQEYKPRIKKQEQNVEQVEAKFTAFTSEMEALQKSLKEHQDDAITQIDKKLKVIHEKLEKEKEVLLEKVDRIFNKKNERLGDQIKELKEIKTRLSDSRKVVNDTLTYGIPAEVLFLMTQLIGRMQRLFDVYDTYDRTPRENDILQFNENTELDLSGALGTVTADPFIQAFTVDALEAMHLIQGKEDSITITCRDIIGTPRPIKHDIEVKLCPQPNGNAILGTVVKSVENGIYTVTLTPQVHGDHKLEASIVVGNEEKINVPIDKSPFNVRVSPPVVNEIHATNITIPGMENPWGIAVNNAGTIAISDIGTHRIAIVVENDFQNPQWIGKEGNDQVQFKSPRGMAFNSNGDIAIVDKENCRVQVVSLEGEFKFEFGKKGSGNDEFDRPTDIVISLDGIIYVSDSNNNRIQYFKPNGKFLGSYGKWGPLNCPYAMASDESGRILITEQRANRIKCLKPASGNLEVYSSSDASAESSDSTLECACLEPVFDTGNLFEPVGIVFHPASNYIVVTELKKHRLSIFDKNGHHLRSLGKQGVGENEFTSPVGIGVLNDSRVVVCDCEKKKIMLFNIV